MSNEYNYDQDAQFFPFFFLTVTSLVTLPLTYTLLRAPGDGSASGKKATQINSDFRPEHADLIDVQRAKQKRKELRLKRMLTAGIGWLIMIWSVYLMIVTARSQPKIWNPYDILDVSMSAPEKDINRRYRRLSLTDHPDKHQPDPDKNETVESVNDHWVEIVKAYKALTDEEVRNNYIQYGNPDGKQSTSFGIALPQFLVAEGSGKYVLVFYGLLLGIGLPWLVGKWWYGMQSKTREKVLVISAGNMFREHKERMDGGDVVAAVSSAMEYREILHGAKADTGLSTLEKQLLSTFASGMSAADKKKLEELEDPVRRKTLALIWAYLLRIDLGDKFLEAEKYELAPTALQMTEAFTSICLAYGVTAPVLASYRVAQSLTQAIPPSTPCLPLLQLPHFSYEVVQEIELKSNAAKKEHMTVQSFMALPSEQRQALAQAAGLDNGSLKQAEHVAKQLPLLKIEKSFFKVQGERYIIPSSLVQCVVKARFIPPGYSGKDVPAVKEEDLLDIDPAEGDLKAQKEEVEQHSIPLAHAPYLARDRSPRWQIFLADTRQGKVAVPPFTFTTFDKPAFKENGTPTFNVVTLKMQFQAPPQPGEYKFVMHMVCDSYVGFDTQREAILIIDEPSKAMEVAEEDEISEPGEGTSHLPPNQAFSKGSFLLTQHANHLLDTIAGQMAARKGQPTADPNKPKPERKPGSELRKRLREKAEKEEDVESDYESGTDDEEDAQSTSATDTETDSDEEAQKAKKKKGSWW